MNRCKASTFAKNQNNTQAINIILITLSIIVVSIVFPFISFLTNVTKKLIPKTTAVPEIRNGCLLYKTI